MTNILHILNGDSTAEIFDKTSIVGDIVVWREMLCEGVVKSEIGSDDFWKSRYDFFESEFGIGKLEYFDQTIKELVKLEELSTYREVVLWFEYDLFCQVNLIAACSYLIKSFRKDINYYLVCTGKEKGKDQLQTLSDYGPNEYKILYKNKVKLTKNDLLFAEYCWNLYIENDLIKLKNNDFSKNSKFEYLPMAIDQHILRFPNINGLNQIENKILELINSGLTSKNKIVRQLLIWQQKETVYGFGDMQYFMTLKNLKKFYTDHNNVILLNNKGKQLVK